MNYICQTILFSLEITMRNMLKITALLSGFLILFIIYHKKTEIIDPIEIEKQPQVNENFEKYSPLIDKINGENNKIKNIVIKNMPIKVKTNGMTFRLSGDLAHEKEKCFRFIVTSKLTGKEMDLGSNHNIFWFWSKRVNPPALYFAKHEDLWKTNLKTPLNPTLMIESLNVGVINKKLISKCHEDEKYFYLHEKRKSTTGDDCILATVIDKTNNQVKSRKLLDMNSNVIVNTIYKDNIIFIEWKDENASMEWDTSNKQINVSIPESLWKMPDYKKKINMGEQLLVE